MFQRSLRGGEPPAPDAPGPESLLAKSALRRIVHERKGFRHELASALLALDQGLPDLEVFLIAAHHGKVRLSIRSLPDEPLPQPSHRRFARGIWEGDEMPEILLPDGHVIPARPLRLAWNELGEHPETGPSWLARMLALRDDPQLGPFRIAMLEAIVKAADERASGAAS